MNPYVVPVYVYFIGSAYSTVDFQRVKRDFARANEIWNRAMIFIKIANGNGVPIIDKMTDPFFRVKYVCAEKMGHQHRPVPADPVREALIHRFTPNQRIALYYIPGKAFYKSRMTVAVTGNETNGFSFKSSTLWLLTRIIRIYLPMN